MCVFKVIAHLCKVMLNCQGTLVPGNTFESLSLMMRGYEMPSAQEAVHSLAGLLKTASSYLRIIKKKKKF